jgi:hypothetical protein
MSDVKTLPTTPDSKTVTIDVENLTDRAKRWVVKIGEAGLIQLLNSVACAVGNADGARAQAAVAASVMASANIGLQGETEVELILQSRYKTVNTAKSGKCGDFIIVVNKVRILIEVKKYTSTVPGSEVDKFYRDIDANSSIDAGLMISLTSRIVGVRNIVSMSSSVIAGRNVPVMFACMLNINDVKTSTEVIHTCIDLLNVTVESASLHISMENDIVDAVDSMSINIDLLSQCRTTIHETQSVVNKQYGKLMQNILAAELSIRASVKNICAKIKKEELVAEAYDLSHVPVKKSNLIKTVLAVLISADKKLMVNKEKTMIVTDCKKMCIRINKTNIKVAFSAHPSQILAVLVNLPEGWAKYSVTSGKCTIELDETSLDVVLKLTALM